MISFALFSALMPVVVLIFVIVYAVKNKEKGEEAVIRHLYTYLVLFATLMMVIGGGISIFMAAADIISPPSYYQSFQDYKAMNKGNSSGTQALSDQQLRASYQQAVLDNKNQTVEQAKNQIIKSLGFIVIPLPVFLYFNRLRKTKKIE